MISKIKMITFDLDDTLWDNKPTITNAEIKTRNWIEERVGRVDWGDFNDFLSLRQDLIKRDKSIAWDIGCLLYTSPSPRDRQKSRMPSSA